MNSKRIHNTFRRGEKLLALFLAFVMTMGCFSSTVFAEATPLVEKEAYEAGDLAGEIRQTSVDVSLMPGGYEWMDVTECISFEKYMLEDEDHAEGWRAIDAEQLEREGRLAYTWKKNGTVVENEDDDLYDLKATYDNPGNYTCDVIVDGKLWTTIAFNVKVQDIKNTLAVGKSNQIVKDDWYKITVSQNAEYSFEIAKATADTELYLYDAKKCLVSKYAETGQKISFERYLKTGVTYYLRIWANENQSIFIDTTAAAKADQAVIDKAKAEAAAAKKAQAAAENAKKTAEAQAASTAVPAKLKVSVKAAKKALTVKWDKQTGVTGYEIQVATNKKFTKNLKTVKVKKAGAASKKIKKLKPKKKYFIRARAYKKISGGTILGAWSKAVKKKTK